MNSGVFIKSEGLDGGMGEQEIRERVREVFLDKKLLDKHFPKNDSKREDAISLMANLSAKTNIFFDFLLKKLIKKTKELKTQARKEKGTPDAVVYLTYLHRYLEELKGVDRRKKRR